MEYYQDLQFQTVMQSKVPYSGSAFKTECNSLEFIRSGKIMLEHDGNRMELAAPVLFWMQEGGMYHFIKYEHTTTPFEHLYCDYKGERSRRITESLQKICPEGYLHPRDPAVVTECFRNMIGYHRMNRELYHGEMVLCVEKIVLEIEKTLRQNSVPKEVPYHISEIADEIRKTPFQKFDFSRIAKREGISCSQFRRLFRSFHNMPPLEFVHTQQMIRISEMLVMTPMRIKDIVFSCNFKSQKDFSRFFKIYSGMSPREYRIRHRNGTENNRKQGNQSIK